jgi:diguanylate cyclase (GGDEF)-like protein
VVSALADAVGAAVDGRADDTRLASAASALGVLRAHQGHTVRALVEDIAALRTVLAAARPGDLPHALVDRLLAEATTGYVEELSAILESRATRDPLTALPNRAGFTEVLAHEIASAKRSAAPALLLVDLDGFKGVNDTDGHLAGDAVLRGVADVLTSTSRTSDVACRLGGDEFAIVLPRTSQRQAMLAARRLLTAARGASSLSSANARVTLSIGIGWVAQPESVEQLIAAADAALYRAKAAGGNAAVAGGPDEAPTEQP